MKCPKGHTNPKAARFCRTCGAKAVISAWTKVVLAVISVSVAIVTSYFFGWRAILWVSLVVGLFYMPLLGVWVGLWIKERLNETPKKTDHVHEGRE